jgi:hypothetical protein
MEKSMSQMVKCLISKCKALSSNPSTGGKKQKKKNSLGTTKKKKKKKEKKGGTVELKVPISKEYGITET